MDITPLVPEPVSSSLKTIIPVAVAVTFVVTGAGLWWMKQHNPTPSADLAGFSSPTPTAVAPGSYVYYFTETSSPTPFVSPATWPTYTNKKYGYSIKYPSNWQVDTMFADLDLVRSDKQAFFNGQSEVRVGDLSYGGAQLLILPRSDTVANITKMVSIGISRPDPSITVDQLLVSVNENSNVQEKVTIGGLSAVKYYRGPNTAGYYVKHDGEVFFISIYEHGNTISQSNLEEMERIVKTFQIHK